MMHSLLSDAIPWLHESLWTIPVIGGVVCGLAVLLGWRFLAARPTTARADTRGLLEAALKGVNQDRRSAPRRRGNTIEVHLSDGSDDPPLRGWVLDRSIGGLCLLVDQAVTSGVTLRVRPSKGGPSTPWTDVTVRSCRAEGGQFELGCQFHHMPNWSLLLMFG